MGVAPLKEEPADVLHLAAPLPSKLESVLVHVLPIFLCNVPFLPAMLNLFCFVSCYNGCQKPLNHLFRLRCCGGFLTLPHSWWIPTRRLQNREHPWLILMCAEAWEIELKCLRMCPSDHQPTPALSVCSYRYVMNLLLLCMLQGEGASLKFMERKKIKDKFSQKGRWRCIILPHARSPGGPLPIFSILEQFGAKMHFSVCKWVSFLHLQNAAAGDSNGNNCRW